MKLTKERSIAVVFDAVSISKDIEILGGPLTQNFYSESRTYIPNRFITPILLTPKVYIVDPNNIIPSGDKHEELLECIWYENGNKIITNDEYKLNKDNTLTVLKNSEKDFTISYSAKWLDPRKKQIITVEDSVQFVTIALGDGNIKPRLTLDKAQNWIHNPLKNERIYSIKAYVSKDKLYEGAVEWYCTLKGVEKKLIDTSFLFYEGGQYSNELKVNSAYMPDCIITAKNISDNKLKEIYWFFDKHGNPLTYATPDKTIIEGSNVFSLPESPITSKLDYRINGLTLEQLVKNGDFRNGTGGWEYAGKVERRDSYIVYTPKSMHNVIRKTISASKNDILYCYSKARARGLFWLGVWINQGVQASPNEGDLARVISEEFKVASYTVSVGDSVDTFPRFGITLRSEEGEVDIMYIGCINLTQTFGAGNEPTKEWCDEHISGYFEGTKSVQTPIRIRSVGKNLLLNGNGEFGLEGWIPQGKPTEIKNLEGGGFSYKRTSGGFKDGIMTPVYLHRGSYWIRAKGVSQSSYASQEFTLVYYDDGKIKYYKNVLQTNHSYLEEAEFKVDVSRTYYLFNNNMGETNSIQAFKEVSITSSKVDSYPTSLRPHLSYITNEVNLSRVGKVFDYIENGKLYKNVGTAKTTQKETIYTTYNWKDEDSIFRMYISKSAIVDNSEAKPRSINIIANDGKITYTPKVTILSEEINTIIAYVSELDDIAYFNITFSKSDFKGVTKDNASQLVKEYFDKNPLTIYFETEQPEVINLDTTGQIINHPNGTIFIESATLVEKQYNDGLKVDLPVKSLTSIKVGAKYLDTSKAVVNDNLITHPELENGDNVTVEYIYDDSPIYGINSIGYLSLEEILDAYWLENVYTYKVTNGEWELVKVTDIEDYEEWLKTEKTSPYTLAPDGIIFGKYEANTKFLRQFPSSLYVDFIAPDRLKEGVTQIKARALVGTKDGVIDKPSRYFKITWLKRALRPGQQDIVIGTGDEILVDVGEKDAITIEIEDLGILKSLVNEQGEYLTEENNKILVGR